MISKLSFNKTKEVSGIEGFRDFLIKKTLPIYKKSGETKGPRDFTQSDYIEHDFTTVSNLDVGEVGDGIERGLTFPQSLNIFKPEEFESIINRETLYSRRANLLLYTNSFERGQDHNLVGIMLTKNYDTESELFKFAASYIRGEQPDQKGPIFDRIQQNLYTATIGRLSIIDALNGNETTAINLLTGREPLIEYDYKISVAKTAIGKGIDFLQTVAGVEFPWTEIPGDYLTNPYNPINYRPQASEVGKILQDVSGAVGSLIGIQRRPMESRKPSDLMIEYMGSGQKRTLFNNLSFSKYAPNYTTRAMSQNSSQILNFADNIAQGAKSILGIEAPDTISYIGDDRSNDVKYAMNNLDGIPVRSSYYLSLMFDPQLRNLIQGEKNMSDGGEIGGKLIWISKNSRNKLGPAETTSETDKFGDTHLNRTKEYGPPMDQFDRDQSTKFAFREDSILGKTQDILDSMPTNGMAMRSHVGNVIDQTSRVFKEGDVMISRGSAVKYVNKFTGDESGVEFCRVWTKDRPYQNNSNLIKRTGLIRKSNGSVLSSPYNINIYPNKTSKGTWDGSTNIKGSGSNFYAKKYMFSIENLAWKSSNVPGFMYNDLPYCERGPNGGRVMWFPPYDLKVNEQSNAKWEENMFLGRPEPVYTYQNTSRSGQVSFKVIVDHPSILNLLINEHFKGMSDEEADNYINAFFAGCKDLDFYSLIRTYTTLTPDDITTINEYLGNNPTDTPPPILGTIIDPKIENIPGDENPNNSPTYTTFNCFFQNDHPNPNSRLITSSDTYGQLYTEYSNYQNEYIQMFRDGIELLKTWPSVTDRSTDAALIYGKTDFTDADTELIVEKIQGDFGLLTSQFNAYTGKTEEIKKALEDNRVQEIVLSIASSASFPNSEAYNYRLSMRRAQSVINDFIQRISKNDSAWNWPASVSALFEGEKSNQVILDANMIPEIALSSLGYPKATGVIKISNVSSTGKSPLISKGTNEIIIDCSSQLKTSTNLKQTAPLTFICRSTSLSIGQLITAPPTATPPAKLTTPGSTTNPISYQITVTAAGRVAGNKVPLDPLKKIIMKILSECYYFQQLEENSPLVFASLREKLKYFHPAFHSMTPEGLNGRLTFLQQCVRPGDTIPVKGITDDRDMNARNTTFGPPPVCIMRIGDFYHSKIIIKDVIIEFEDNLWDLNPEGIGIQPMIANVTLSIAFIGGHGLEKPVERLQNSLSFNFYGNTEIYDPRSTATEDRKAFTKEFLEKLMVDDKAKQPTTVTNDSNSADDIPLGGYIGYQTGGNLATGAYLKYDNIINNIVLGTENYFTSFADILESVSFSYGRKVASLFFSPLYRTVKDYDVETGTGTQTIELLGQYKPNKTVGILSGYFKTMMLDKIKTTNISVLMGIDKVVSDPIISKSETIVLKPYFTEQIGLIIDSFSDTVTSSLEKVRNNLIQNIDSLNFIIQTSHDGKIEDSTGQSNKYLAADLSGYTYNVLYSQYAGCINYILTNNSLFMSKLDTGYTFDNNSPISDELFTEFLQILMRDYTQGVIDEYTKKDKTVFTEDVMKKISKRVTKFFEITDKEITKNVTITTKLPKFPVRPDSKIVQFKVTAETEGFSATEKENLVKTISSKSYMGDKLNYYRNKNNS